MVLLTPGVGLIFWQLLIFGILFLFLSKYAWGPITKSLKEREKFISDSIKSAEKAEKELEKLNDKFSVVSDIPAFIYAERESKREELRPFLTTALKVDKETNMGIVGDIKQELRKVNDLKINYTTRIGDVSINKQ